MDLDLDGAPLLRRKFIVVFGFDLVFFWHKC